MPFKAISEDDRLHDIDRYYKVRLDKICNRRLSSRIHDVNKFGQNAFVFRLFGAVYALSYSNDT